MLTALPRARSRGGRISDGYTQTVAWKPMVKKPWNRNRRSGRRPMRSRRSQGMKEAAKNQVWRKPDMRAERCAEKFREEWKGVAE